MRLRNKKTGEIIDFEELNGYCLYDCGDKIILGKNPEEPVYGYTTLKEFNEDWEDYEPKEPLIKDEETRKLFIKYLEEHPNERFFQAVRNFSRCSFILASPMPPANPTQQDTFYWECDEMIKEEDN